MNRSSSISTSKRRKEIMGQPLSSFLWIIYSSLSSLDSSASFSSRWLESNFIPISLFLKFLFTRICFLLDIQISSRMFQVPTLEDLQLLSLFS
uniref:Uncharacterized protein n=1 Tax=Manihot esculenta TaxID=3983 RepID=A0A2C9URZ5_MANES